MAGKTESEVVKVKLRKNLVNHLASESLPSGFQNSDSHAFRGNGWGVGSGGYLLCIPYTDYFLNRQKTRLFSLPLDPKAQS